MADNTTTDDVYDDPDNILADDDAVDGAPTNVPDDEREDLEMTDPLADDETLRDHPEEQDPDADKLGDMDSKDADDGTEN